DGVLRIIGLGGYNPGVGDSFTLIRFDDGLADASDLSGVFANVQWSGFHPGLRFDVAYHSNSLVVTAVPVPAAVWLFASGLLGVLTLGRRRVV
ncbi:MAG: hypothetical protein KGZ80_07660, partial [Methylomonas sp.]|nr:hypothetical protein [Methylomonas sp.]